MRNKPRGFGWLPLIASTYAGAVAGQELLAPIDASRAQRIAEYNAEFMAQDLAVASRHRIVAINAEVLFEDQEITLTLFDDVEPVRLTPSRVLRTDGTIHWAGTMGNGSQVFLSALAWDVDTDGLASPSNQNPRSGWRINDHGVPELQEPSEAGGPTTVGPPPETPDQIASVLRSQSLTRKAFHSVVTLLTLPGGNQYVLKPLSHTPRYAVVYKTDLQKLGQRPRDRLPHEKDLRTESEKRRAEQDHMEMTRLLALNKPVRGDIE